MKYVEIFEGERAAKYDISIKMWCPDYDLIHELIPCLLFQHMNKTEEKSLLIAGCGTGAEMATILKTSPSWNITGIDPSIEMTKIAADKLNAIHSPAEYKIITGTIADLPLVKYDAATLILVLHFLTDEGKKLRLLTDISGRLTPGAPLILVDIFGQRDLFLYNLSLLKVYLVNKGINENLLEQGINHIKNDLFPVSEERLIELLNLAGFGNTKRFHQSLIFGGWITEKI